MEASDLTPPGSSHDRHVSWLKWGALALILLVVALGLAVPMFRSSPTQPERLAISSNGILLMSPDGTDQVRLTSDRDYNPAFSPDGSQIVYLHDASVPGGDNEGSGVFVINTDGTGRHQISANMRGWPQPAVWSPDGQWIAYTDWVEKSLRGFDNVEAIFVVHPDGSGLTNLTGYEASNHSPSWSSDSKRIVFARSGDPSGAFAINVDGSGLTRLTETSGWEESPEWSPDGSTLAFGRASAHTRQLMRADADGSDPEQLTEGTRGTGQDLFMGWSPDGSKLAFWRDVPPVGNQMMGRSHLCTINPDGSGFRNFTEGQVADIYSMVWAPDSRQIAYVGAREDGPGDLYVLDTQTGEIRTIPITDGGDGIGPGVGDWWAPEG